MDKTKVAKNISKIINELHGIDKQKPLIEGVDYHSATAEQSEASALSQEFIDFMRQRSLDLLAKSKGIKEVTNTPIMSSVFKSNPARQRSQSTQSPGPQNNVKDDVQSDSDQEEINTKKSKQKKDKTDKPDKKDPLFSSVGSGKLQPIKAGDTLADVGGKLFNFMRVEYDWEKKKAKRDKKYRKKIDKIKDRQLDEMVAAITGKKTSILGKFGRTLRKSGLLKYGLIAAGGIGAFYGF